MVDVDTPVEINRKWMMFGLAATALNYVFLLVVVSLIQMDGKFPILVLIAVSIIGGVAAMIFVL